MCWKQTHTQAHISYLEFTDEAEVGKYLGHRELEKVEIGQHRSVGRNKVNRRHGWQNLWSFMDLMMKESKEFNETMWMFADNSSWEGLSRPRVWEIPEVFFYKCMTHFCFAAIREQSGGMCWLWRYWVLCWYLKRIPLQAPGSLSDRLSDLCIYVDIKIQKWQCDFEVLQKNKQKEKKNTNKCRNCTKNAFSYDV